MLSGIKRGKRKRSKSTSVSGNKKSSKDEQENFSKNKKTSNENLLAANELRKKLMMSVSQPPSNTTSTNEILEKKLQQQRNSIASSANSSQKKNEKNNESIISSSVDRRIGSADDEQSNEKTETVIHIPITSSRSASCSIQKHTKKDGTVVSLPEYEKQDLRHSQSSRRGKYKPSETLTKKTNASISKSIHEMIQEELSTSSSNTMSMDEIYARNIARLGSRFKGTEFSSGPGAKLGADEEELHDTDVSLFTSQNENHKLTQRAMYEREVSKQIANHKKQLSITSKCFWWMDSPNFHKHMLLSLGDHVSLVLAPAHLSLTEGHCYLVPVKHAESFASCEDDVWEEVKRFKRSLRSMYTSKKGEKMNVLFLETVLPSSGFWQTKMDVIPVPQEVEHDAPLHFKSALNEQAQDWGVHNKLFSTSRHKTLRQTIPTKKSFPYFSVEWDNDDGYVQLIEASAEGADDDDLCVGIGGGSKGGKFPKDFGFDVISNMMDIDPIRFKRKQKKQKHDVVFEKEKKAVLQFCKDFENFDWTYQLDDGA